MKHDFKIGDEVRTYTGTFDQPNYVYGIITEIRPDGDGYLLYKVDYQDGISSSDWMYDCEIELVRC